MLRNRERSLLYYWIFCSAIVFTLLTLFATAGAQPASSAGMMTPKAEATLAAHKAAGWVPLQEPDSRHNVQPEAISSAQPEQRSGTYHALVIGIDHYEHEPELMTPVNDATAVAELLKNRYGFRTQTLLNTDASRDQVIKALEQYASPNSSLTENDSLLIYFAGHGQRIAVEKGCELEELPSVDFALCGINADPEFYRALELKNVLALHDVPGGTAPQQVKAALKAAKERLSPIVGVAHVGA